jgi:hypothetical protein
MKGEREGGGCLIRDMRLNSVFGMQEQCARRRYDGGML